MVFHTEKEEKEKTVNILKMGALFISVAILAFSGCGSERERKTRPVESFDYPKSVNPENLKSQAIRIIGKQLSSSQPETKVKAIEVVGETGLTEFAPELKEKLTSDYLPVRFTAAVAVGDMRYELAKPVLEKLVEVDDKMTRLGAAYALYKLGDEDKLQILKKAAKSKAPKIRANAAMLLGKSGASSAIEVLRWVQHDDKSDAQIRLQALEARARLNDESTLDKLWAIIYSSYIEDRIIGITAMGALGTQKTREILITKLDDDTPEVRLAAAEQLGYLGNNTGIPEVAQIFEENVTGDLEDRQKYRILTRAAFAIGAINSPKLTGYLPELLKSESELVRLAAAQAVIQCLES